MITYNRLKVKHMKVSISSPAEKTINITRSALPLGKGGALAVDVGNTESLP